MSDTDSRNERRMHHGSWKVHSDVQDQTEELLEEHQDHASAWEVPREVREVQVPSKVETTCVGDRCSVAPTAKRRRKRARHPRSGLVLRVATDRGCPACSALRPVLRWLVKMGVCRVEVVGASTLPRGGPWRPRYVPALRLEDGRGVVLGRRSGYVDRAALGRWIRRVGARRGKEEKKPCQ